MSFFEMSPGLNIETHSCHRQHSGMGKVGSNSKKSIQRPGKSIERAERNPSSVRRKPIQGGKLEADWRN